MIYLDTSILLALYIPEEKSDAAEKLVRKHSAVALSALSDVEFHSAVSRLVRMRELTSNQGNQITSLFHSHSDGGYYRRLEISHAEFRTARDWLGAFGTPLRTWDALHLAVAFNNNLPIATNDKIFAKSAKTLGVKVVRC